LHDFEKEPLAAFGLVEDLLQRIACGRVAVLVADLDGISYHLRYVPIVLHEPLHHLTGRHEIVIVIFNGLQLTYMAATTDGRAAYATDALSHDVDGRKNRIGLLVEKQVIVTEVRTGEAPVEVLRLDIEREKDEGIFGIGPGLRPDLTGKGIDLEFVQAGIAFAKNTSLST
jgi:hypothetical protein